MPSFEFEMIYRLRVRGPMASTKGSPRGERIYWEMSEATLDGARIKARTEMPGGDWYAAGPDSYGRPDVSSFRVRGAAVPGCELRVSAIDLQSGCRIIRIASRARGVVGARAGIANSNNASFQHHGVAHVDRPQSARCSLGACCDAGNDRIR